MVRADGSLDPLGKRGGPAMSEIKIVFCWTGLTGYMPACWRALSKMPGVDIRVFIEKRRISSQHAFQLESMKGISFQIRDREDDENTDSWIEQIAAFEPDLIQATGWFSRLSQAVVRAPKLTQIPKILGLDHQYRGTIRQRMAPFILNRYLHRFDAVCVPGERAAGYARHLGFQEQQIERPLYGFDYKGFFASGQKRAHNPWPKRFLFAGRYCHDKGVASLVDAYRLYRTHVCNPWPLSCCGMGECASMFESVEGVTDLGFCPPNRMPELFAEHGVFVLPSLYEPWGVVLGEAAASGLPVIATSACGSSVELVRSYYNGLVCAPDHAERLCEAMVWMHHHYEELPRLGERSARLAEPYSAEMWATSWLEIAEKLRGHHDHLP